jgi:hypothetical protein
MKNCRLSISDLRLKDAGRGAMCIVVGATLKLA